MYDGSREAGAESRGGDVVKDREEVGLAGKLACRAGRKGELEVGSRWNGVVEEGRTSSTRDGR